MALKLKIERHENRFKAEFLLGYHKVKMVFCDAERSEMAVVVRSFADEAARMMTGAESVFDQEYRFFKQDLDSITWPEGPETPPAQAPVKAAYLLLKANTDRFKKAEDI